MFGFGLKLKAKPKPTISAVRRPRDQVVETSQKNDSVGHQKPSPIENIGQNPNAEQLEIDQSEKSASPVVSSCVESGSHEAPGHLETENINTDSKNAEAPSDRQASSSHIISLENNGISDTANDRNIARNDRDGPTTSKHNLATAVSTERKVHLTTKDNALNETPNPDNSVISKKVNSVESSSGSGIANQDDNRLKTVPFIPKFLSKKNKFVPNVRVNRKTDDQLDKSTLNSPQKSSSLNKNEANNLPALAAISERHDDCNTILSKTVDISEMSEPVTRDHDENQSVNEQSHAKETFINSPNTTNPPKELLSPIKPILERSADKENTICNDDDRVHNPGNILQNIKKKKPRPQGTFLQMTIEAKKELDEKLKDGKLDKSKLIMRDLIHYNPTSNPMTVKCRSKGIKEEKKFKVETKSLEEEILSEQSVDDVEATRDSDVSSMPVPQLKVGPDGKIILDSSSLVIETTGTEKSRTDLQNSELVEENEFSVFKYRKRRARRNDWSAEETVLFYKALNDIGADFSMMERLFPNRTRRDLKLKFKKEEKTNLSLIDKAMTHKCKFDFEALQEELTRDREERSRRKEEEARLKEIAKKELKLQKQQAKVEKALEKQLKAENSQKLKQDKKKKAKQEESNSRKGVKRNQKMSANKEKRPYKRSRKISSDTISDVSVDYQPKYCFNSRKRSEDDPENLRYDTIFKTTKSGRSPKVRKTLLEESEKDHIQKAKTLLEQLESLSGMGLVEGEGRPQHLNSQQSEQTGVGLFEDLPMPEGNEEYITPCDEDHECETPYKDIGSGLPIQNLPHTIRIVEEITSGIPRAVNVDGVPVMCKIIALNNGDRESGGSSTFQVRNSEESNCGIRFESVAPSAVTDCEQLSYVINFDKDNGESIELSSGMVTSGRVRDTYILPQPHFDHPYSKYESPAAHVDDDDDGDGEDDGNNDSPVQCKSYVVLEPNESVEIYNGS